MATLIIPGAWTPTTAGKSRLRIPGDTVGAVLAELTEGYPDLRRRIFNGEKLASWVNVFIGDEDIRTRDGLETTVTSTDTVLLLPAVAGG